jgi:L-lactate utilization protein LutB
MMEEKIVKTISSFRKNNIQGYYAANQKELFALLSELIPAGSTVGCGDSVTMEQLGVFEYLKNSDVVFYDKHKPGLTGAEKREIYLDNFRADVFISGTNAVTENGEILNIDGNGSRVAPMIYGPGKVIVIIGSNKITKNSKEGMTRVRQTAAPMDAARLGKETPCAGSGKCSDCKSPDRICNTFVMIARQFKPERIHVIIVDGEHGY